MTQDNKKAIAVESKSKVDEYQSAIDESISRQLVSITYYYSRLEALKN
ncbi:MAG: hypothetical protein Aureis2KO_12460 [Aureisphaera sp.]